jgi:mercuric ion binding protein
MGATMRTQKDLILIAILLFSNAVFAKEIKISVKGMVCAFCAQGITKKFKARPDVESVDVSLEKKLVTVRTKADADITDQQLTSLLTESGYNVEKIER